VNAPTSSLIPTDRAIQMVFDWFFANGGTNLRPFRTTPSLPGVATIVDPDGLESPLVHEYTIGVGGGLGTRGYVRADIVWRDWDRFYSSVIDTSTGKVTDTKFGTNAQFDLEILGNDSDIYERNYTAVQTQFNYRALPWLTVGGTYTWSRLTGNVIGEDAGAGPLTGGAANYPQYREARWNYPTGYLPGDQRHRAKFWTTADLPTRVGGFTVSLLESFESGTRTSLDGSIDSRPYVTNPGYLTPPAEVGYFFTGRGALKKDDIMHTDVSLRYAVKFFRGIEFFVNSSLTNLFNEQGVVTINEEVLTAIDCPATGTRASGCPGALSAFNPFTEKPVEHVHYEKGPNFGKADSEIDYQAPRTFRLSIGLRF